MKQKIIITGASRGIGRGLAEALARQGHELFLVARDTERLEKARAAIANASGNSNIFAAAADLSNTREVRKLAASIRAQWRYCDVLLNNHGAVFPQRMENAEGLEMNFALNYLSVFLLTHELLPLLRESSRGRVLNVAAEAHRIANLDLEDLQYTTNYESVQAYCRAKLMVIMFTRRLAARPEAAGLDVIAAHPGSIITDALRTMRSEFTRLTGSTEFPQAVEVSEGIAPLLRLIADDAFIGSSGNYFVLTEKKQPSEAACDRKLGAALWQQTEEILERC